MTFSYEDQLLKTKILMQSSERLEVVCSDGAIIVLADSDGNWSPSVADIGRIAIAQINLSKDNIVSEFKSQIEL
jgi:hypothetical protein